MAEYEGTQQETDLGFYTFLCFLNYCCFGNILGFILCFYCRHKIKRHAACGNSDGVSKWAGRFWLCMLLTMFGSTIVTIVSYVTTGTLSFLGSFF